MIPSKSILTLILTTLLCSVSTFADSAADTKPTSEQTPTTQQTGLEKELEDIIDIYTNQDRKTQMRSVNTRVRFSGITDVRLFDIAEKNLLGNFKFEKKRKDQQYTSWLVQMLAFSGQEKYRASIERVLAWSRNTTVKRHSKRSLEVLSKYRRWNTVISQNLQDISENELNKARAKNMINAEDPELIRAGASILHHFYLFDKELTDLAEERLLAIYEKSTRKSGKDEYAEASAWLCKVLGGSMNQQYYTTLQTVLSNASSQSLKKWARKSLYSLGGGGGRTSNRRS